MKQVLLTTSAIIACMMFVPPVEARPAPRHNDTDAGSEADHAPGNRLIAVAQVAPAGNDEKDEENDDEDVDEEDEDKSSDPDQGDDQDDESTTAEPGTGPVTGDEDDIAVEEEEEDESEEKEEEGLFPTALGILNATINGTATFQAGVMGDRKSGLQFRNETDIELNVRGKADNGLLYGLKVQFQTETGFEPTEETTLDEAYIYLAGPWGRLEFGDTDDVVAGGLLVYAPNVGIGQIDGDHGSFSRLSLDDYYPFYPDIGSSTKINYYTPRIGGFQAGVSYSPYLSDSGQSVVSLRPGKASATSASTLLASQSLSSRSAISQTAVQSSSFSPRGTIRAAAAAPVQVARLSRMTMRRRTTAMRVMKMKILTKNRIPMSPTLLMSRILLTNPALPMSREPESQILKFLP